MRKKSLRLGLKSLLLIFLITESCGFRYNSIRFTKDEGYIYQRLKNSLESKKIKDNTVLIHSDDKIYQVNSLDFSKETIDNKMISGKIVPEDTNLIQAYDVLKLNPKGEIRDKHITGSKGKFLKQTHIFVDSLSITKENILISTESIKEVKAYYLSKALLVLMIGLIAIGAGALIAFVIYVEKNLFFEGI